jgi:hypothetical protein
MWESEASVARANSEGGFGSREGDVMMLLPREQLRQILTFKQIRKRGKGLSNFGQKTAIKVHHAQKSLQILDSVWPRKV